MALDKDKVKSLISTGSDIAGAATGGAIGFLTGGPGGAALGGSLGVLISKGLSDITNRVLSTREKMRVGATATFALAKIKTRLDSGDKLRSDGFFDEKKTGRSDADEIFEGVLLKAKNEHEEKKTKIMGNIFANIAFSQVSAGEANHLLQITENLTYREMCILSLIKRKDEISGIRLRGISDGEVYDAGDSVTLDFSTEKVSVLQQAYELCNHGLMICSTGKGDMAKGDMAILWGAYSVIPDELLLTVAGHKFYEILGLDDIPEEDIREVAKYLS
jgi:hypothetical protein